MATVPSYLEKRGYEEKQVFGMCGPSVTIGGDIQSGATYGLGGCTAVAFFDPEKGTARCVHIPPVCPIPPSRAGEIAVYYTPENSKYSKQKYARTYSEAIRGGDRQSGIWEVRIVDKELEFTDRYGCWHRVSDVKCSHPHCESNAKGHCARCRKVQYCSKVCQKNAWNHHGHRKVCGTI